MAAEQIELRMAVPVCAWCRRAEDLHGTEPDETSHGICPRHLKKLKAELLGTPLQRAARPQRNREHSGEPLLPLRY